ncbi:uncharacterized protein A4U43_C03F4300 [Asparagus officinalis]|uniref:Uncharacterized protein n=1 Tax=Asparagus officinalis TaxID=4686 RepID=A0A5P1FA04_ASPOF|nr:uncharacterized protein A4U43_C03F4300 [Asparagus officinalis]
MRVPGRWISRCRGRSCRTVLGRACGRGCRRPLAGASWGETESRIIQAALGMPLHRSGGFCLASGGGGARARLGFGLKRWGSGDASGILMARGFVGDLIGGGGGGVGRGGRGHRLTRVADSRPGPVPAFPGRPTLRRLHRLYPLLSTPSCWPATHAHAVRRRARAQPVAERGVRMCRCPRAADRPPCARSRLLDRLAIAARSVRPFAAHQPTTSSSDSCPSGSRSPPLVRRSVATSSLAPARPADRRDPQPSASVRPSPTVVRPAAPSQTVGMTSRGTAAAAAAL